MALELVWGDEGKTFIYTHFHRNWTWDEMHQNANKYTAMVASVTHRVDYVADLTDTRAMPPNLFANIELLFARRLPNEGYTIIVGANSMIVRLYKAIENVMPSLKQYVIFEKTLEDAKVIIQRQRETSVS